MSTKDTFRDIIGHHVISDELFTMNANDNKEAHFDNNDLGEVSMSVVNQYLQLATLQQIATNPLLDSLNISHSNLHDNSQYISGVQFQQLLSGLITISNDPLFGLHTAEFVQPSSYSILGFISMNCETLGEAVSKIPSFEKLVGDMGITSFDQEGDSFKITWKCLYPNKLVSRHMIDNCLASWLNFAHYLSNRKTAPVKVHFCRKAPINLEQQEYQKLFNCPVLFNRKSNSIFFEKRLLAYPLNHGNKKLLSSLENLANEQLDALNKPMTFIEQIEKLIKENLESGLYHQQEIALIMGISAKTLQRKFTAQNLQFQTLLDKVRLNEAMHLLQYSPYKLYEISLCLGFKETRSFHRWFLKLMKKTPGQFRQETIQYVK